MKVALVHDDLVQWGGAERVLLGLSEVFPDAPIYTSVFNKDNKILAEKFAGKKVITSFMQKIPFWKNFYKFLLPLYPIAFEQLKFDEYDLVISQTTRFAKSIITKPGTKHICYCHTPPRFLYGFGDKRLKGRFFNWLRRYDQISSKRVDKWIAGSKNAATRIKEVYDAEAEVIYPFVDLMRFKELESFKGDYLLLVSRLNSYKRVDLVVKLANQYRLPLKIIGVGPELRNLIKLAGSTVEFLGDVDEDLLVKVISGCKALVICGEEDFGLTPLEAAGLGKPVIAFQKGGVLETIINGKTGYLFKDQNIESLKEALDKIDRYGYNERTCLAQAEKFSLDNFKKQWSMIS